MELIEENRCTIGIKQFFRSSLCRRLFNDIWSTLSVNSILFTRSSRTLCQLSNDFSKVQWTSSILLFRYLCFISINWKEWDLMRFLQSSLVKQLFRPLLSLYGKQQTLLRDLTSRPLNLLRSLTILMKAPTTLTQSLRMLVNFLMLLRPLQTSMWRKWKCWKLWRRRWGRITTLSPDIHDHGGCFLDGIFPRIISSKLWTRPSSTLVMLRQEWVAKSSHIGQLAA